MKIANPKLILAVAVSFAGTIGTVRMAPAATTIYSDNFNNETTDGAALAGRTPSPADATSGTYVDYVHFNPDAISTTTTIKPQTSADATDAYLPNASAVGLGLTSDLAATPAITPLPSGTNNITISALAGTAGITAGGSVAIDDSGVGTGFFTNSATLQGGTAVSSASSFTGFIISPGYSYLKLFNAGTFVSGTPVAAADRPVTGTGGVAGEGGGTLVYQIDPTNGNLIDVKFNGVDYTSSFASSEPGFTGFTNSELVGFFARSEVSEGDHGLVDDFTVTAIPEPASVAMLGLGAAGLLGRRRRV